jgi:hypothetical protein
MIEDKRGRLLRFVIAAALVAVATGVALLASNEPIVLLALYVAAVGIAAWKGGWRAGAFALMLATTALLVFFSGTFDESHLIGFVVDGAIATAIMEAALPRRHASRAAIEQSKFGRLVAVEPIGDPEEQKLESEKRREIARNLERAAATQLAEQRKMATVSRFTPKGEN